MSTWCTYRQADLQPVVAVLDVPKEAEPWLHELGKQIAEETKGALQFMKMNRHAPAAVALRVTRRAYMLYMTWQALQAYGPGILRVIQAYLLRLYGYTLPIVA